MKVLMIPCLLLALPLGMGGCSDDDTHSDGPACGNGILEGGEVCDGSELGGRSCESIGFGAGTLGCTTWCTLDTLSCHTSTDYCGDGVLDAGEACDGTDFGVWTCLSLGLGTGSLVCNADCTVDASACVPIPEHCGNGVLDTEEICDGDENRVPNCAHQGFDGGVIGCTAGCTLDVSGCYACGDLSVEGPEVCDDGNRQDGDGCSADCLSLETCGNGIVDTGAGEDCESTVGGLTCADLNLGTGTLTCDASCLFDTSDCETCGNGVCDPQDTVTSCPSECAVLSTAVGYGHSCALLADSTVRCWGGNTFGTLGNGTTTDSLPPVRVTGLTDAVSIAASGSHNCALLGTGQVRCWGENTYGQLGDGSYVARLTPVTVSNLSDAMALAVGSQHTCAVRIGGEVVCWGNNNVGQLGVTGVSESNVPVTVSGISTATSLGLGSDHSCAVLDDFTARCWGGNISGQLGNNTYSPSATPVSPVGLTGVSMVAAAGSFTCALHQGGTASCWGSNSAGQLGTGAPGANVLTPTAVSVITNAVALSAGPGGTHACVVLPDDTALCWGYNFSGQIGNGSNTDAPSPVAVSGLTNVSQITAAYEHTCAALTDGTAWCWGQNNAGQLGDRTLIDASTPVQVEF